MKIVKTSKNQEQGFPKAIYVKIGNKVASYNLRFPIQDYDSSKQKDVLKDGGTKA